MSTAAATATVRLTTIEQLAPTSRTERALLAACGPIITARLNLLNKERIDSLGGDRAKVRLRDLDLTDNRHAGARGIAFEYAVHRAIRACDPTVTAPLFEVLDGCGFGTDCLDSIFFAIEKQGALSEIDPDGHVVSEKTHVLVDRTASSGLIPLQEHLPTIKRGHRHVTGPTPLPDNIGKIWKTDLLVGDCQRDIWLPATVKSNPAQLEPGAGLALGIIPCRQGTTATAHYDDTLRMWIAPLPYDDAFMETFSIAFVLLEQFFAARATVPHEATMPTPAWRRVAAVLAARRDEPAVDVAAELADLDVASMTVAVTELAVGELGTQPPAHNQADVGVLVAPLPQVQA